MRDVLNSLDEKLVNDAENILEETGLDFEIAVKIMLKRLVRERSVSFLFDNSPISEASGDKNAEEHHQNDERIKMTKNKAINLFRNEGIEFNKNVTFASKNKGAYHYWANPNFDVLKNQWYLILNDWSGRELYLFIIPAKAIAASELTCRSDKEQLIDLQIMYEDRSFTDIRSKFSFAAFLKKTMTY